MIILLAALAVAFAAFCVWLTVRIISRRERWAKRAVVGLALGLPVLYVASFVPVCAYVYGRLEATGPDTLAGSIFRINWTLSAKVPKRLKRPLRTYWKWWLRLGQTDSAKDGPTLITSPISAP
jgi:hypothetical protein